jgi:hypothetical protein
MISCFVAIAFGLAFAQASPIRIVQESHAGSTRNLILVGRLSVPQVVERALSLLGPADVTFGRLVVYASQEGSRMVFRENQTSCMPQSLVTFLRKSGLPTDPLRCPEISEVIKIGSNILLRTVDTNCQTSTRLLRGTSDPLVLRSMGEEHRMLAISVGLAPHSEKTWGASYPSIWAFVRTQAKLKVALAKQIIAQVKKVSGARDAVVVLRNDAEFGRHCHFPSPYLFDGPGSIISEESSTSQSVGEVVCTSLYPHPVKCWMSRSNQHLQ